MVRLYLSPCLFAFMVASSTATATLPSIPKQSSEVSLEAVSSEAKPHTVDYLTALKNKYTSLSENKTTLPRSLGFVPSLERSLTATPLKNDDLILDPYHFNQAFENPELITQQTQQDSFSGLLDNNQVAPPSFHSAEPSLPQINPDASPYYISSGQDAIPFGRAAKTAMITPPLITALTQTTSMPIVVGFQSSDSGPFIALYAFRTNISEKFDAVPGLDTGYIFKRDKLSAEIGLSYTGSLADATGLQNTGAGAAETFGGFASMSHGTQEIKTVPALDFHGNITMGRYKLLAEWLVASRAFEAQDLSFNDQGARPQAGHLEAGVNFTAMDKDAGVALGYQWSKETLALSIPNQRISAIFDIEWWPNTRERFEYRHDIDFPSYHHANGAAPEGTTNQNSRGTGKASDAVLAQISVYF